MDTQSKVPAVSISETEEFWTGGEDARQPATGAQELQPETSTTANDSIGIDTPGVGVVRPGESSPVELGSGRENAAGEVTSGDLAGGVEPVKERRERLFSQLIFAARELALAQIEPADDEDPPFCTECTKDALGLGAIAHEEDCRTGRVLRVIVDLVETLRSNPNPKEAAPDGEMPEAGDGIRPRGPVSGGEHELLRSVAGELLGALYTMIGLFGMPTGGEVAREIRTALANADAAKVQASQEEDLAILDAMAKRPPRGHGWNHVCNKCGESGGHWTAEIVTGKLPGALEQNQSTSFLASELGYILYTHQCVTAEGGGAQ